MSVPPTPGNTGETPPESSAPNSNGHQAPDAPVQQLSPNTTPRTTARPQAGAPPMSPTYPPQPAPPPVSPTYPPQAGAPPVNPIYPPQPAPTPVIPTQPPAPTAPPTPGRTAPPAPASQQMRTQPPAQTAAPVPPVPPPSASPAFTSQYLTGAPRWQRLAIAAVAAVVLVVLGIGGFGLYATHEAQQPALAAQAFCHDLQTGQYSAAYTKLSTAYQAKTSQAQFVEEAGLHDQVDGPVASCAVLHSNAPKGFTLQVIGGATVVARIMRHKQLDGTITVVKEGNDWRVGDVGDSLQGTTLAPLFVGMSFCKALVAKDYAAAYSTFSSHERSGGTESAFAATFTKAFGANQQITGCAPTVTSYVVSPHANAATVDVALQINLHIQGNGLVTIAATVGFVTEGGAWKLDSVAIKSA